jgi:hypothetical protein
MSTISNPTLAHPATFVKRNRPARPELHGFPILNNRQFFHVFILKVKKFFDRGLRPL